MTVTKRLIEVLSWVVAVQMASASVAGLIGTGATDRPEVESIRGESVVLFGDGVYRLDTLFKGAGNVGTDIASIIIGVPVLIAGIVLFRRGGMRGRLLLTGALAWPLYVYATLALGTAFNPLFLVYVATFSASLFALVLVGKDLDLRSAEPELSRLPSRGIGIFMIGCGAVTFTVWMLPLVGALLAGLPPRLLGTSTTMVTDALDLAIITPLTIVGGVLLIRGRLADGYRFVTPLLIMLCVLGPAIVAQTVVQLRAGVTFEPGEVIGPMVGFLVLAAVAVYLTVRVMRVVAAADERQAAAGSGS